MRYNDNNCEHIGGKSIIGVLDDNDSLFEVSAVVVSELKGSVRANYDLTVYGDIEVSSLTVMGDLICFGECKAEAMNVQGSCTILGNLQVSDGLFSDMINAHDIEIGKATINGDITCNSISYEESLECNGKIIATDGVMGLGTLECSLVICGEYASVDDEDNDGVFVIAEVEEYVERLKEQSTNQTSVEPSNFAIKDIASLDWDECKDYLQSLSEMNSNYTQDYLDYSELLAWSDASKLCDLKQVVELAYIISGASELIKKSDLYCVIKTDLLDKTLSNIDELILPAISEMEFSELLYKLNEISEMIPEHVFTYIQESLFNKIGLKYNTVQMMLKG